MLVHSASFRLFFHEVFNTAAIWRSYIFPYGYDEQPYPCIYIAFSLTLPCGPFFPVLMLPLHMLIDNFQLCGLRLAVHRARAHSKVRTVKWKFETSCVHQRYVFKALQHHRKQSDNVVLPQPFLIPLTLSRPRGRSTLGWPLQKQHNY